MKSKQKEKRPPLIEGEIQFLNQDSTRRDYLVKSGDENTLFYTWKPVTELPFTRKR